MMAQLADPSLSDGLALGYVGIPLSHDFRHEQQLQRATDAVFTSDPSNPLASLNEHFLRAGLPQHALALARERPERKIGPSSEGSFSRDCRSGQVWSSVGAPRVPPERDPHRRRMVDRRACGAQRMVARRRPIRPRLHQALPTPQLDSTAPNCTPGHTCRRSPGKPRRRSG